MPIAGAAGVAAPGAVAIAGLTLALSTTFNPLVGGLFSLVYGAVIVPSAARAPVARADASRVQQRSSAVAVMWCVTNDMVEGAANVIIYGFGGLRATRQLRHWLFLLDPCSFRRWPPYGRPQSSRATPGRTSRARF